MWSCRQSGLLDAPRLSKWSDLQRNDVVIDACTVGGVHSSLLQQACHLTGGIYLKPARMAALLQYFLVGLSDYVAMLRACTCSPAVALLIWN